MSFRTVDLMCPNCKYEKEETFDLRGYETEEQKQASMVVMCPNCEEADMVRCWRGAPSIGGAPENSPITHAKRVASFKQRFLKKEIDDVRHKHGHLFDASLRGAAVDRIKKDEVEKTIESAKTKEKE
jgi:RNA polymerase subunit RPABC4/transcription elongation factor Spt4